MTASDLIAPSRPGDVAMPGNLASSPVSAAVLAGGQSRRMGLDKATLILPGESLALLDRVLATLRSFSGDILVVGGPVRSSLPPDFRQIPDEPGAAGPLRGIAAALRAARHDRCLVVACDQPFLSLDLIRWLATLDPGADAVVPLTPGPGDDASQRYQPLHAIYARRCLPMTLELLATTGRASALLERVATRTVAAEDIRRFDPDLRSFVNLNTPEDVSRVIADRSA